MKHQKSQEKENGQPVKIDRLSSTIVAFCVLLLVDLVGAKTLEIDATGYYYNAGGSVHIKMD